ncbi:hypothetical protein H6F89_23810 [Cyanobacteria bacterium FACHB-63]|nr:hypothetical protein [Cyanobacteria bacterium FACHB-63]
MAANDINKRPNYFDGQFLQDIDFRAEQDYYLDRQRRFGRLLCVSGISEGLTVSAVAIGTAANSSLKFTVAEGTAIDSLGRQLVLANATTIASKTTDGVWLLTIRYDQQLTDPQADGAESFTRWQETPLLEFVLDAKGNIVLARVTIQNGTISAFDLTVRQYAGIALPNATSSKGATLRTSAINPNSDLAVLSGSLSITGQLSVTQPISGDQATFNAIGIGITNPADISKKLQIEQGELRIRASHNQTTADIAAFLSLDQKQGLGVGSNRIEAIGSNPDQSIELRPKGSGQVAVMQTLSVQKDAIAEAIDDAHLNITATSRNFSDYAKLRFQRNDFSGWLGYHGLSDPAQSKAGEFVLWDGAQKQPAALKVGDLVATRSITAGTSTTGVTLRSDGTIRSPLWKVTQLFNNIPGPLPGKANAKFSSQGGTILVFASGTGVGNKVGPIGIKIQIDSKDIGVVQADSPTGGGTTRYCLIGNAIVVPNLGAGEHTLILAPLDNTNTNDRDYFNVTLLEFPF